MLPFLGIYIISARKRIKVQNLFKYLTLTLILFVLWGYYFNVTQIMGFNARYYLPSLPFVIVSYYYLLDQKGLNVFNDITNSQFKPLIKTFFMGLLMTFSNVVLPVLEKLNLKLLEQSPVSNNYDNKYLDERCILTGRNNDFKFIIKLFKNSKKVLLSQHLNMVK